ncbi:MAG: hypothetical protein AABX03_05375 [Nanoarchaeota archaeon]
MKKKSLLILLLFLLIFSITFVSSLEIKPVKTDFMKGETFQATIDGNVITTIKKEDVGFYKNNAQIPLNLGISKINHTYYIYAILPYESRNYTLIIKNVYYSEFNQFKKSDLELNFSISNQTSEFNVNPGFISTTKNFEISVFNNLNSVLNINYGFEGYNASSLVVQPQSIRQIPVSISSINSTSLNNLKISSLGNSYTIPVNIIKLQNNTNTQNNNSNNNNEGKVSFTQNKIKVILNKGESYFDSIDLENFGDREVNDISISLSENLKDYLFIPQNKINSLKPGESVGINFTATFTKTGNYTGFIFSSYNNESDLVDLEFFIGEKLISNTSIPGKKSCSELNGNKCSSSQFCSGGSNVNSLEGFCCLGQCKEFNSTSSSSSGSNWLAIIAVLIILGILGAFLYFKYKKPKTSSDRILKKREDDFSERFETSGKLSKL